MSDRNHSDDPRTETEHEYEYEAATDGGTSANANANAAAGATDDAGDDIDAEIEQLRAEAGEAPTPDDLRDVHAEENPADAPAEKTAERFFVTRDATGRIRPTEVEVPGYGTVTIRMMVYGEAEAYFGDAGGAAMVGPSVIADILRNHVVDPDFDTFAASNPEWPEDHLTPRIVSEEMQPFAPNALLQAILEQSGLDNVSVQTDESGNAAVEFDAQGNR